MREAKKKAKREAKTKAKDGRKADEATEGQKAEPVEKPTQVKTENDKTEKKLGFAPTDDSNQPKPASATSKAGGLSKAERRALQEAQRKKKEDEKKKKEEEKTAKTVKVKRVPDDIQAD